MALPDRCIDVTPAQVAKALESSASMAALLRHMARIARPGEGAPKILVPIARMASNECIWIDEGGLTVEITPVEGKTVILVAVDLGLGMRELLFPRLHLGVPYEEFTRVLENAPQLVFPMKCRRTKKSIFLTCAEEVMGTLAPPSFATSEADVRSVLPAKLRNSLAPIQPDVPKEAPATKLNVETGPVGEVAILARLAPKALRARPISEVDSLDMGWDVGAYSSGVNSRETKPPPPNAKLASKAPTRPPPPATTAKSTPAKSSTAKSTPAKPAPSNPAPSKPAPAKPGAKPAPGPAGANGPPRPALRRASKRPARPKP